jgi:hypothetical protein
MKKICTKCKEEKHLDEFSNYKSSKDGKRIYCKICSRIKSKERYPQDIERINKYREDNKDKLKEVKKAYSIKNKEILNARSKQWAIDNKERLTIYQKNYNKLKYKNIIKGNRDLQVKHNIYNKNRYHTDPLYKISQQIRTLLYQSFKFKYKKQRRTQDILGCTYEDFRIYLESKFEPWMNWENQGKYNGELNFGWDMDHIIPISSAKSEEEVYKLNHFTNYQPLCSKVNRDIKKNKI